MAFDAMLGHSRPATRAGRCARVRATAGVVGLVAACTLMTSTRAATAGAPGRGHEVAAVVARAPQQGRLMLSGYVARIYLCPPCPAGVSCKPCLGDHLVLSDDKHALRPADDLGPSDVLVFAERSALRRLRVGQRYQLVVDVRDTRAAARPVNDLALVRARPIY
jgi:hypothetical protein